MTEIVYKQTRAWDCADYAMLSACQKLGVAVTEKDNIYKDELTLQSVAERLIKEWKIKRLVLIKNAQSIDFLLKNGHYIVCGTGKLSFSSVAEKPFIQKFDGTIAHNFCIVEDCWDLWKVKDSQWPKFADGGYWYMKKSNLPNIKRFRIEL